MKRLTLLGAILAATLVSGSALTSLALGTEVPENLPAAPESGRLFEGLSVEKAPKLNGKADSVACANAVSAGTEESGAPPHGEFHITFQECKETSFGQSCNGTGDAKGIVLVDGTWQLVWDRQNGGSFELTAATVFFVKMRAFECTPLAKFEIEGSQVCLDLEPESSKVTHDFDCIPIKAGSSEQSEDYCLKDVDDACVWITPDLSERLNGGKNQPAAEEASGAVKLAEPFTEPIAAMLL